MHDSAPLLMIPGPIEVSEAVFQATCRRPPSHVAPDVIAAFGDALDAMCDVWLAGEGAQPFCVAGGGTLAMESAATNLVDPGESVLVVNTGYFGDRMAEMLRRRGAVVSQLHAPLAGSVTAAQVAAALEAKPFTAVFATHVDTSTGVRLDVEGIAGVARAAGVLSCFDGVCATAGERFEMGAWGADVYLTGSQKAIGLPAGLALWVASDRAMARRRELVSPPPMTMDWLVWEPIMTAYRERRPSYFSTPATTLLAALQVGLRELVPAGGDAKVSMDARFDQHLTAARAMRAAWQALGLSLLPSEADAAHTLSAILYPEGVDGSVLPHIKAAGAIVAGGLHPALKPTYFRVGHMGEVVGRPDLLVRTVRAVGEGLAAVGHDADVEAACSAARSVLEG
jgi:alanine-glyoxylate transaminase/serine-glyoxylate transaminase/serine-pyruvate transaminase